MESSTSSHGNKFVFLGKLQKGLSDKLILVGGSAVELYTYGMCESIDLDLVMYGSDELRKKLKELGFKRDGRTYQKNDIVIDIVDTFLGDKREQRIVYGDLELTLVSIEDLIIDRMCGCKYWESPRDCEQAYILYILYRNEIDMIYLSERARNEYLFNELMMMKRTQPLRRDEKIVNHEIRRNTSKRGRR